MAVAVKMCHLLSAACQDVSSLGRWPVISPPLSLFGAAYFIAVKILHLWAATCQDVSSLGRCSHFLWFSGVPFITCQLNFANGCKLSYFILGLSMAVAVKMFHLWAATCQDVSSLGRWPVITV